jgi:undecaprenyl diphosphate synthase
MTAENTGMNLIFALNYGGRQEITAAAKCLAQKVAEGTIKPDEINETVFAAQLESAHLPDPDLIIRTSGEQRLSNFYLWQSAYSEIMIVQKHWPDFTENDFHLALKEYARRERRFGQVVGASRQAVSLVL